MPSASLHTSTHALWLSPSGVDAKPVSEIIHLLAREFSGPVFTPHLTLVSGLQLPEAQLLRRTARLASQLCPTRIVTEGVGMAAPPFRALFLPVLVDAGLCHARCLALEIFDQQPSAGFLPHLSLFYGDFPADQLPTARDLVSRLGSWAFQAEELHLISAFGPPAQWRALASFPLSAE